MSFSDQEKEEFKAEALELLDVAEKSLLALDAGAAEFTSAFDAIFRSFHNLKGAAGMMEYLQLQAHTHELETILMDFKGGDAMPKEYLSMFLGGVDAARTLLDGMEIQFNYDVKAWAPAAKSAAATPPPPPTAQAAPVAAAPVSAPETAKVEIPDSTLNEFVSDCEEIVERISKNLQLLEGGTHSKDSTGELYRDIHSLKGASFLFTYNLLGEIGHAMESSLEGVRNGTHAPSPELIEALFQSLKLMESLIGRVKHKKPDQDLSADVSQCAKVLQEAAEKLPQPSSEITAPPVAAAPVEVVVAPAVEHEPQAAAPAPEAQATVFKERESEGASSIRVPVALLDNLMTLMGEMVLVRNQVLQYSNQSEDLEFLSMSKRLNVVTSEIQGEMMKTRMQPIGNVLGKFTRLVRDLSHDLKKNLSIQLVGSETELDKSLLEAIKDPLTHIVRNSCDHGVETPDVRRSKGKPEGGTIVIKAYHEGGQVVIEVSDDGKGLMPEVLVKKAIEKGLLTPAQAAKLTEKEVFNLIFAPGFSTAAKVTNVSGRGVGMDVVRTNIERIGGTVDLSSVAGHGTSIKIKIPLTLAIVPALLVKCAKGSFAIPQVKLEELVRIDEHSEVKIEILHGAPVYRLRGRILPLVDLNKILGSESKDQKSGPVNIAVLNAERGSFGLIIDEIQDTADIVVKPLNRLLKSLQVYSGATVLGDGSIALILDVLGISKVAEVGHDKNKDADLESELREKSRAHQENQDFLLVRVGSSAKHALVLGYVHRLEEFKKEDIEYSGSTRVIRYRNAILPLVSANEQLGYKTQESNRESIPVIVVERAGALYGIEVDEILDTLSTTAESDDSLVSHPGIFGNLNTPEELIVVVDPFALIAMAFKDMIKEAAPVANVVPLPVAQTSAAGAQASGSGGCRILVVEDTVFFRRAIKKALESGGHEVFTANDGKEAIDLLNKEDTYFDLIVSDIEMPRINGFELAGKVRQHARHSKTPMLAISSRADKRYRGEGQKAGFNLYLEKLQPEVLLASVAELTQKFRGHG